MTSKTLLNIVLLFVLAVSGCSLRPGDADGRTVRVLEYLVAQEMPVEEKSALTTLLPEQKLSELYRDRATENTFRYLWARHQQQFKIQYKVKKRLEEKLGKRVLEVEISELRVEGGIAKRYRATVLLHLDVNQVWRVNRVTIVD